MAQEGGALFGIDNNFNNKRRHQQELVPQPYKTLTQPYNDKSTKKLAIFMAKNKHIQGDSLLVFF